MGGTVIGEAELLLISQHLPELECWTLTDASLARVPQVRAKSRSLVSQTPFCFPAPSSASLTLEAWCYRRCRCIFASLMCYSAKKEARA